MSAWAALRRASTSSGVMHTRCLKWESIRAESSHTILPLVGAGAAWGAAEVAALATDVGAAAGVASAVGEGWEVAQAVRTAIRPQVRSSVRMDISSLYRVLQRSPGAELLCA